ncbi:OmpH family outer membrane protein [Dysgonomonas sp. 25]|uniref:OmpH family outer membrane protein n=1 Tax=Dysgonomonas sp. 25 TaxID=2302933 RepID=UPI0013D2C684|nr:OmpH family outer membrane protein [Dysgonomonas sp. 25]NDV68659.1 OmpH family outer membrane protein [Dysgonomonas sp. 25]
MLKKLLLVLLIFAPVAMFAQDKIAYLNAQEIFAQMPEMLEARNKLAEKEKEIQTRAQAIENEYMQKVEEFSKTPTDELKDQAIILDRQKQLDQLQERYQSYVQTSQAAYEKEREAIVTPIQEKLVKAIQAVGEENGYTYILDRAAMLYVGPNAVDASAKVKAKLGIN